MSYLQKLLEVKEKKSVGNFFLSDSPQNCFAQFLFFLLFSYYSCDYLLIITNFFSHFEVLFANDPVFLLLKLGNFSNLICNDFYDF